MSPERNNQISTEFWLCVTLCTAVIIVYWPVKMYQFVQFDDGAYILNNPWVREGLSLSNIAWAFQSAHASNWHPLTWLSHMLDVSLFGLDPGRHHVINVLIHMVNSVLLLRILKRMTGKLWLSSVVAALFAVHPLNIESVAWISERKNLLCTLFGLLTLGAYVRYIEGPGVKNYLLVFLLFLLSLIAKPMLVTLPFLLLLLDCWPLDRFRDKQPDKNKMAHQVTMSQIFLLAKEKIPLFALSGASCIVTFLVQQSSGAVKPLETYPLLLRIENSLISYFRYIIKTVWPFDLAVIYPYPKSIPAWKITGSLLVFFVITVWVIRRFRRHAYLAVGWFWYLGTLVPVIGLVQVGPQAMADRYAYIPVIGLFIALTWGGSQLFMKLRIRHEIPAVVSGALFLFMTIVSCQQVRHWKDSIRLFQHAVDVTASNPIAHQNLALALAAVNRLDEAVVHFNEALRVEPSVPTAHNNLGTVLLKQGKHDEAMHHFSEALRLKPEFSGALYNLGNALAAEGRLKEAIGQYKKALAITPADAEIHNNLGNAFSGQNNTAAARHHYEKAISMHPSFVPALLNLAKSHVATGEYETARLFFKRVIHLKPDTPQTYYLVAVTYAMQGRGPESVEWLEKAVSKGFKNWEVIKKDRQLNPIRQTLEYRNFIENGELKTAK